MEDFQNIICSCKKNNFKLGDGECCCQQYLKRFQKYKNYIYLTQIFYEIEKFNISPLLKGIKEKQTCNCLNSKCECCKNKIYGIFHFYSGESDSKQIGNFTILMKELSDSIMKKEEKITSLNNELQLLQFGNTELQNCKKRADDREISYKNRIIELEKNLEKTKNLQNEGEIFKEKTQKLSKIIEANTIQISNLENSQKLLNEEKKSIIDEKKELFIKNTELNEKFLKSTQSVEVYENKIKDLKIDNEKLDQNLQNAISKLKNLQNDNENFIKKNNELMKLKEDNEKEIHELKNIEIQILKKERSNLEREKTELKEKLSHLENELNSLKSNLKYFEDKNKFNDEKVERLHYDLIVKIDSLNDLKDKGWEIEYQTDEEHSLEIILNKIKEKERILVGVIGYENVGKTYLLNKLSGCDLPTGFGYHTTGLSFKLSKQGHFIFADAAGCGKPFYYHRDKASNEKNKEEIQRKIVSDT